MTAPASRGPRPLHLLVFFLIALVGQNLDLWTKMLAFERFAAGPHVVIDGVLGFQLTLNPGIIWGLGPGFSPVFLVISIVAVPLIVWLFYTLKEVRWSTTISLGLILAGTLGNMFDRISIGKVRDFIDLLVVKQLFDRAFPLFNLADAFICSGVFLLAFEILFLDAKKKAPAAPQADVAQG